MKEACKEIYKDVIRKPVPIKKMHWNLSSKKTPLMTEMLENEERYCSVSLKFDNHPDYTREQYAMDVLKRDSTVADRKASLLSRLISNIDTPTAFLDVELYDVCLKQFPENNFLKRNYAVPFGDISVKDYTLAEAIREIGKDINRRFDEALFRLRSYIGDMCSYSSRIIPDYPSLLQEKVCKNIKSAEITKTNDSVSLSFEGNTVRDMWKKLNTEPLKKLLKETTVTMTITVKYRKVTTPPSTYAVMRNISTIRRDVLRITGDKSSGVFEPLVDSCGSYVRFNVNKPIENCSIATISNLMSAVLGCIHDAENNTDDEALSLVNSFGDRFSSILSTLSASFLKKTRNNLYLESFIAKDSFFRKFGDLI